MIDAEDMAIPVADTLNAVECWTARGYDIGEIHLINEFGQRFLLTIEEVDSFPEDEDGEDD